MALTTCSELKEAIATWLARSGDAQITGNVSDFIVMAEAHFNRHLRTREMETVATFTTTTGVTNLADDYLAWKRMTYLAESYISLEYLTPEVFNRYNPTIDEGTPRHFTIEAGNISIRPYDDDTEFEFLYYAKVPALVEDDDTNWLLTAHPDLYLAASLTEANAFLINPEHAQLWTQKRDAILADVMALSEKTKGPSAIFPIGTVV